MKKGFSLIELIIVVSILAIIFSMGTIVYSSFVRQDLLQTEVQKIQSIVSEARMKTIAGYRLGGDVGNNFGVYFEGDSYTLFAGQVFQENDSHNQKYLLPQNLIIEEVTFPADSLVFTKVSGEVINYDENQNYLVLSDKNLFQRKKIIVNLFGAVKVEKYEE